MEETGWGVYLEERELNKEGEKGEEEKKWIQTKRVTKEVGGASLGGGAEAVQVFSKTGAGDVRGPGHMAAHRR